MFVCYASMPIFYHRFVINCLLLILFCRQLKESIPDHNISTFGRSTGISVLRKHLLKNHIEQWVTICDNLKIPITAKSAEEAVRVFRKEPAPTSFETHRPTYSKEAFVDAIVDFIVGDDQVRKFIYLFIAMYLIKT